MINDKSSYPLDEEFLSMTKERAEDFFATFMRDMERRCISILELSHSPVLPCPWDSSSVDLCLRHVSKWLMSVCRTRQLTIDEIDSHCRAIAEPIRTSMREMLLKNRSVHTVESRSYCIDVGILYIEIYRARNCQAYWTCDKNKNSAIKNIPYLKTSMSHDARDPSPFVLPAIVLKAMQSGHSVDLKLLYSLIGKDT